MTIALDVETTGLDLLHHARPFFVTTCNESGEQAYWEWSVDPVTREVAVDRDDLLDIQEMMNDADRIVGQNFKFDCTALTLLGLRVDWDKVDDTLIAGHLLASNEPHNLTDMAMRYLGMDIEPFEKRLEVAVKEARVVAKRDYPDWRTAKKGDPLMPSAKEKAWKSDTWLPLAIAEEKGYAPSHRWRTVLSDYANADSATTLALWKVQGVEMKRRKLTRLYQERMKFVAAIHRMELHGVTGNEVRLQKMISEFKVKSESNGAAIRKLAHNRGYDLVLPRNGNNKSLLKFSFDVLKLPAVAWTDSGAASLNAAAIERYAGMFDAADARGKFISGLLAKRQCDTAISYLTGYLRFKIGSKHPGWFVLHPNVNPTGTDTLRCASNNPNGQNISKRDGFNLRRCFGPTPNREWWAFDAQNIERRIPAYEAGEDAIIALFERPGDPPYYGSEHALVSHLLYPKEFEACRNESGQMDGRVFKRQCVALYDRVKRGNFALQNGCQREKADATYGLRGAYDRIKSRFSKQEALNAWCIAFAEKHGYIETMPDRTVDPERGYPLMCSRSNGRITPTVPFSYRVQGSAMWWMMKAMIRVQETLDDWKGDGFNGYIVLQVHDELVLDFPRGRTWHTNWPKVMAVKKLMEEGGRDISVPTPVATTYHLDNYAEATKMGDASNGHVRTTAGSRKADRGAVLVAHA